MDLPKLGLVKETDPPDKPGSSIDDDEYDGGALYIDSSDLVGVDVEEVEEEEEEGNEDDGNVKRERETDGRDQEGSGGEDEDGYEEEAGASENENEEEEEEACMKAFEFETCCECKDECSRPVKELCGHVKCRDCFIGSGDGCMQCVKAGRLERKRSNSALGMDDEEDEEVPDFFFDENDENANEGDESEEENHLENDKLIVKSNEYVFELGDGSGTKSIAVVSKETLIGLGINPDGHELHQERPTKNNQPSNNVESSAEVIVPDTNLSENDDDNIPPETSVKSEPREVEVEDEEEPTVSPPSSPSAAPTQPPSQTVSTDTTSKDKARRGKRRPTKAMKTDHIIEIEVVDTTPSPIIGPDINQPITKWKCLKCDQEFNQEYRRKYHYYCDPANGKRPFACEHCSDEFISQSHYQYHVRSKHTGEKPYECPICFQRFIQKVKLNRHMTTHSTKPKASIGAAYLCAYCKKRFNSLQSCRRHIKLHTDQSDDKPFACDICQKSFKQKYSMEIHRKIHKNERPHKCPECDKGFSTAKDMRRHHLIHTGELPFECAVCNIKFRRKDNLERHIRTTHRLSEKIAKVFGKEAVKEYKKKKASETRSNRDS